MRVGSNSDFCLKIVPDALGKAPYGFDFDSYRFVRGCGVEMTLIWARPDVIWEATQGDFRALDAEIGWAMACGIEPVIKLAPLFDSNGNIAFLTTDIAELGIRYPGVRYFIVGNEPGNGSYGDWRSQDWQGYIDQVIAPCSAALKAARPDALLIGPEADSPGILDAILQAEAGRYFDVIGLHCYPGTPNFPADSIPKLSQYQKVVNAALVDETTMKNALALGRHYTRPVFISECGPDDHCLDGPGSDMVGFLKAAEALGYDAAFTYRLRSETEGRTDITGPNWEHGLTMLAPNWGTVPLTRAADPFRAAFGNKPRVRSIER